MLGKMIKDKERLRVSMAKRDYAKLNRTYKTKEPDPNQELNLKFTRFGLELKESKIFGDFIKYRCRLIAEPKLFFERLLPVLNMYLEEVMFAKEFFLKKGKLTYAITVLLPRDTKERTIILERMASEGLKHLADVTEVPLGRTGLKANKPKDDSDIFDPMKSGKGAYTVKARSRV